jgi:lipoprotein NlpI
MKYISALTLALLAAAVLADETKVVPARRSPEDYAEGLAREAAGEHQKAIASFTKAIELDVARAEAYNHRGSEHFKLGHIKESIADFDAYLKLKPDETPGHWKRGISYYYAGVYDRGRKQFEGYEKVDTNDVENAVWRYLCMARSVGVDKARAEILKIGNDRRIPMMKIYQLFCGKATPEELFAEVRSGKPSPKELNARIFYAHQYLGLYYEAQGDEKKALAHMEEAVKFKIDHYMWDVANVHVQLRKKQK